MLLAAALWAPVSWDHAIVLIFFMILAGPAVDQAMGSAAYRLGLQRATARRDDLAKARIAERHQGPTARQSSIGNELIVSVHKWYILVQSKA